MTEQSTLTYLDNAATSFPKPPTVGQAMHTFLDSQSVNPGRTGFDMALAVGHQIDGLRRRLMEYFNSPSKDPNRTIFAPNATGGLNLALQGLCRPGDHVVSTVLEHNSVLRPLYEMERSGRITYDLVDCDGRGFVDPDDIAKAIKPNTRLVAMTHASNVFGTVQPAAEVGRICGEHGIYFLLDAAQSAGTIPVDMAAWGIHLLAFTGHKSLLGPTGTGGLLVADDVDITSTLWGGTGVRSAERTQPQLFPYRLEAGTLNTVGLVGLAAGLEWVSQQDAGTVARREHDLAQRFLDGLAEIPGIAVLGRNGQGNGKLGPDHLAVVSLTMGDMEPAKAGMFLDNDWDIAVRTGPALRAPGPRGRGHPGRRRHSLQHRSVQHRRTHRPRPEGRGRGQSRLAALADIDTWPHVSTTTTAGPRGDRPFLSRTVSGPPPLPIREPSC